MENKILENIKKADGGLVYYKDIPATMGFEMSNAAINNSAVAVLTGYKPTNNQTFRTTFTLGKDGNMTWRNEPFNPVELKVESNIDMYFIRDAASQEKLIREEIANKLARKMIEEDLITIYTDHSIDPDIVKVRAKVKFIQE